MAEFAKRLSKRETKIVACKTFEELYGLVRNVSTGIYRIGPLAAYDTATRIGAKLRLFPHEVYLHAGTRQGAAALGFDSHMESVHPSLLPQAFKKLRAYEIEDVLCIYKKELRKIALRHKTSTCHFS